MKRPGFEADRFGIMALDLASGATREIDPQWDRSASALKVSADGKTLYTTTDDWGDHALFARRHRDAARRRELVARRHRRQVSTSARSGMIVARAGSASIRRTSIRLRPTARASSRSRTSTRSACKNIRFGDGEFFTFKGAGGDTVQGYVVKPVDYKSGKKYPVAFIIHGGPQGAMTNDFHYRWNPQTYAGQGFAVVTINFHGSTGYGQKFTDAISGDWGGAPLEDLKLGWAAALDKYRFLDGDRACALGASYGGYMAYWIAGNWNRAVEMHRRARRRVRQPHDELLDRGAVVRRMGARRQDPVRGSGGLREIQPDRPRQGLARADAGRAQRPGFPHSARAGPRRIHRAAAPRAFRASSCASRTRTTGSLKPHNSVLWHDTVNAWLKQWTAK